MRNLSIITLLLLLNLCVYAQKEVFRIDSLPKEGILLNKGWKFHAGDNPDFAKPDFDDSKWESIDPSQDVMDLEQFKTTNIGWLRLTIQIDSSLFGQTFALSVRQVGSSQIYNNGKLVCQIGQFSSKVHPSKGYDPSGYPYRFIFGNKITQTLSIKFEKPNLLLIKHLGFDNNCLQLKLIQIEETLNLVNSNNRRSLAGFAFDYFKSGLFLIIAFLHFWLFGADKKNINNLILGFWAFAKVFLFLFTNFSFYPIEIITRNLISILTVIFIPILSILHCYALYSTFSLKIDAYFKLLIILTFVSIASIFLSYDFGWAMGAIITPYLTSLLIFLISWQSFKKGDKGALVIAISELTYAVCSTWAILNSRLIIINYPEVINDIIYNLGIIFSPIAIVYYFAYYYNINRKKLQHKLVEVQQLSFEKQQALQRQNAELQAALLQGQTIERKRVAADLHDNLGSTLSALWLSVDMIDKSKMSEEESAIHQNLRQNLEKAYNDVRLLSHNLLPEELEKQGLSAALHYFVRKINQNSSIKFNLQIDETLAKLDKKVEFELYSICLELVNNIIKHSKATEATLRLHTATSGKVQLTIEDNGIGIFENNSDGKGMKNVRARVESLNGFWNLVTNENIGTKSQITIPI
ncbi:ATP-binding protein [Emticicia sp. W12TSBA100-4]|uniref:sensor histidine kinase n=1 Tax=Emticicia sp. W12TSBA100-4 TaxID=3160965 RepID=UPI0033060638